MNPRVAVLVPLYTRVERIPELLRGLHETTPEATLFLRLSPETPEFEIPDYTVALHQDATDYPSGINFLAREARKRDFPYLFVGADDIWPHPGWYERALAHMKDGVQVVGTNDLGNPRTLVGQHATHFLVDADFRCVDDPEAILSEAYGHSCVDDELFAYATAKGIYAHAEDSIVEHQHPLWGHGEMDETYAKGQASYDADLATFKERKKLWEKPAETNGNTQKVALVIGIPSRGNVRIEWANELASLRVAMPVSYSHMIRVVTDRDVVTARNTLVKDALAHGARYLFFLDDDVLVPNQTIRRFVWLMDNNPDWDLLSGIVVTKSLPTEPCIFNSDHAAGPFYDWTFGEQFEISGCGMAAAIIRTDAFKKVPEPWFEWKSAVSHETFEDEGEDMNFCRKLREAGGKLMADGGLLCGHINSDGKVYALDESSAPIQRAKQEELDKHAFLGQEKE